MSDELLFYLSIFGWLFFTGVGLPPVPEEAGILYAAGLHATYPEVDWPIAWLATGAGIVCADTVLYGIGRKWGARLFELRWVQRFLKEERRVMLEGRFHQHGIKLLILARFLPPLRTGVFLIAGASEYPFLKFLLADLIYAVFGVGAFFFGGTYIIGALARLRQAGSHWAFYLSLVFGIGFGLYRYFKYLHKREQSVIPKPPVSILQSVEGATAPGESPLAPAGASTASRNANELLKE